MRHPRVREIFNIFIFLLQAWFLKPSDGKEGPLQGHTVFKLHSGLIMERVPVSSAHFYKEYVPLVYQFTTPRWNKSDTKVYGSQNCNTTTYTKFFTTCPILYYLNDLHDRFSEYLVNNQPLVTNLEEINAKPEVSLIPFDCELVKPHFEDIYVDKMTLEDYLGRLKTCSPLSSQEFFQGISNYVYNISGIYLEMRRNFYYEYWLKIDLNEGRVDAAIWANAVNTLNSLIFENYLMESIRWKTAVMDCEAGRIPSTILPPSLLGDTLNDMLESLGGYHLSPTVSIATIGNYYKSQLTDCTFTNDTFLVRILIPVIPETEKFLLVKLSPVSFFYEDKVTHEEWQCQVDSKVLPESGQDYVLIDLIRSIAYESDCKPGQLCHIHTALHARKMSKCATAAFNWERFKTNDTLRMDLIKYCPVKCSPVYKFHKSSLQHIDPFEFLWFNGDSKNKDEIVVNCSTAASLLTTTIEPDYLIHKENSTLLGSTLIEIGCNCHVIYKSQIYKSKKPCNHFLETKNQIVQISRLAPIQWYSISAKKVKEFWNVPEAIFYSPDTKLIKRVTVHSEDDNDESSTSFSKPTATANEHSQEATSSLLPILCILLLGLTALIIAVAYRLRVLIKQLETLGFNVKGQGTYNVLGVDSGNGGGSGVTPHTQQISYRNMRSSIDTDLLVNERNE